MNSKIALLTVASIGTAGGVDGLGYWYSIPKDLKDLLIKEGKQLLDVYGNTSDAEWKKLADKYKGNEATITLNVDKQVNKIGTFRIDASDTDGFAKLKNKCKELFEKKISDKEDFKTAKQDAINWCIDKSDALTKELKSVQTSTRGGSGAGQGVRTDGTVQQQLSHSASGERGAQSSGPAPSN
ncbi:hypothetical protein A6V39_00150 [Candidatus Mycoplasma haematobovis]|uniref:Uncharacterized protein n=1 Tax=Candidatus Mycoplasma haematobovis TaxID=432608 RepID=A0A1A9QFI7_9MOLU|nr:hypothetical protein [Candidatus Mycoplasma haematobovis]OAL10460.1 hypothetical protein A6V39_00150 [Candidatus Mycoplasma haematobovis]